MRYKIVIEYDGSTAFGWQKQNHCSSVQQFIEEAIEKSTKERVDIFAAGRTDSGVHALAQVAHFDLSEECSPRILMRSINHFLRPNKIVITDCQIVDDDFHARFSAKKRYYRYLILNRTAPSVLNENRAWHIRSKLDIEKMQQAANLILGVHDFTSFRTIDCQAKSPIKTLSQINIHREGEMVIIDLSAPSFLHHMVRNIVGTLVPIGLAKLPVAEISNILQAKNRCKAGVTAPAYGLYFSRVDYEI